MSGEKTNKQKEHTNSAEKKQQNSNMASWFGANIKILSLKRKYFFISPQLLEAKLPYSALKTEFPLQATDVMDATALA
jgi:hypothetical protein